MNIDVLVNTGDILGEGPVWHEGLGRLFWTDIERGMLQSVSPDGSGYRYLQMPERLGSFAFCADGRIVVALETGIAFANADGTGLSFLYRPQAWERQTRFNDGKCDPAGRFLAGTLDLAFREPIGALYSVGTDMNCRPIVRDVCISNGLCWSPDGRRMYFADSPTRRIDVFDYDAATGEPSNRRVFCDLSHIEGTPDGATVAADGSIWAAIYDGGRVLRIDREGRIRQEIGVPMRRPTACAFGGEQLDILFVTGASDDGAAAVLRIEPGCRGLPSVLFGERNG